VAGATKPGQFGTELLLRAMGLLECRHTPVGSPMVRGVSGGQRKRVTTVSATVYTHAYAYMHMYQCVRVCMPQC